MNTIATDKRVIWNPDTAKGTYLRNAWYVAAWSDELGQEPLAKLYLEQPVALFRDDDGTAHAIGGRCPHRFAPLGKGTLVDGNLQCPYHGLRFDSAGNCVFNPHESGVVPKVSVKVYPLVERHNLLWIWMGDEDKANPDEIPDFGWLRDDAWAPVRGAKIAEGHYELYSDNIMDLGHTNFVHSTLGANSWTVGTRRFWQEGDEVWAEYFHPDDYLSEGISAILGTEGRKQDLWVKIRWNSPATMLLDFRAGDPGTAFEDMTALPSLHAFTPETMGTTHYHWSVARGFELDNADFTAAMQEALEYAFEHEDMPIIRDAWRLMADQDFDSMKPISLTGDAGGVRARRVLKKRIEDEQRSQ